MKTTLLVALTILAASLVSRAQAPDISGAPKAIQELSAAIQGKSLDVVRAAIIERFDPPQRDVGSGFHIEQWDISNGVLTFHPLTGPSFFDLKTKKIFRLVRTTTPVHASLLPDNIMQSYEMTTIPDPASHDERESPLWLGDLKFSADMTYQFVDSGQFLNQRGAQTNNFFMRHPTGKVAVRYVAPISPDTLLETVREGATVAYLTFTSADGKGQATFSIVSSEQARWLEFRGDKPLSFRMGMAWKNIWQLTPKR